MPQQKLISDQLRQAIDASGMGRNQIARKVGIDRAAMSRFMAGKHGVSTPVLDELGRLLGLELRTNCTGARKTSAPSRLFRARKPDLRGAKA